MMDFESRYLKLSGKIGSWMTHDLNNVLAIIIESSGLLSDYLTLTEISDTDAARNMKNSLSIIDAQMERGKTLVSNLNRFSHIVDDPPMTPDRLGPALDFSIYLVQGIAKRTGITLQPAAPLPPGPLPAVKTGGEFAWHGFFMMLLDLCVSCAAEGDMISVSWDCNGTQPVLLIDNQTPFDPAPEALVQLKYLTDMANDLGCRIDPAHLSSQIRIQFP